MKPIDAFRRILLQAFAELVERVDEDALKSVRTAIEGGDDVLAALVAKRPSATWTYMVNDDPFASAIQSLVRRIKKRLTPGRGRESE